MLLCLIFFVYLGHGMFHPVAISYLSRNQFLREVLSSQIEEPRKERGAPLS